MIDGKVEKDITEGLRLIKYSFDHNDSTGISDYAYYLSQGLPNLEKDLKLSFKYAKLAANMGNLASINNVGAYYQHGQGTEVDKKKPSNIIGEDLKKDQYWQQQILAFY